MLKIPLEPVKQQWQKLPGWARIILLAVVIILIAWMVIPGSSSDLPTSTVQYGEFVIDLNETGLIRAQNSVTVNSPPVRTTLQIIDLVPEGTQVKEGDFLVQFDTTDLKSVIDDRTAELDIARSNLVRSMVSMESRISSLRSSVEGSSASYRLAQLRLEQMQFEADKRIEEGKLSLKQAELAFEQAKQQVEAQLQIDSAEVRSLKLKIRQAEIDLEKSYKDLEKLRIMAPAPGLVIYQEFWRGSERTKIKIGDTPWRGAALIELPDLSVMMVETSVSEVDISKVKVGQDVEVKLDAYPDPTFPGKAVDVAVLAGTKEGVSKAKIFDVLIRIDDYDPILRPGMSATARIIVDRIPDKMWLPIEAIFNHDNEKVAWVKSGSGFKPNVVKLGARNDNFVIVESGVDRDDVVALLDPTLSKDERPVLTKGTKPPEVNNENSKPRAGSRMSRRGRH